MSSKAKPRWAYVLLVAVLLLGTATACISEEMVRQWLDQLVQKVTQTIERWMREQIERLAEDVKQQLADWWEDLQRDIAQKWHDFWNNVYPPAPTITAPADGTITGVSAIGVSGEGLANSSLVLYRNDSWVSETVVSANGRWTLPGVVLRSGENSFRARVKGWLPGRWSETVTVTSTTAIAMVRVPEVTPFIDPALSRFEWMAEAALEAISDDVPIYAEGRHSFTRALRRGLLASWIDDEAHHYTDSRNDVDYPYQYLVYAVPKGVGLNQAREAVKEAVMEAGIADSAVLQKLSESVEFSAEYFGANLLSAGGEMLEVEFISIRFERELIYRFDPEAWSVFKTALGTHLASKLAGGLSEDMVRKLALACYALWGRADADSQAQHYFDLAVRAWNYDGDWDDWDVNTFDGVEGVVFDSNEEWAMYYLGRTAFYVQIAADPFYTIPYYKLTEDTLAILARQAAEAWAKKQMENLVGKIVGGGTPITYLSFMVDVAEILNVLADDWNVHNRHRPLFAEVIEGIAHEYAVPDEYVRAGSSASTAGQPFRHENDLMVHDLLGYLKVEERDADPPPLELMRMVHDPLKLLVPDDGLARDLVRQVASQSEVYVHEGGWGRSDMRIPEVDMITDSPYLLREVYLYENLSTPGGIAFADIQPGDVIRLTLLEGEQWEGEVARQFVWPDLPYHNTSNTEFMGMPHYATLAAIELQDLRRPGSGKSGPCAILSLIQQLGSRHVYAVCDLYAAFPRELLEFNPTLPNDMARAYYNDLIWRLVGIDGAYYPGTNYDEQDGTANIAQLSLLRGTEATVRLLRMFARQAPIYVSPPPIIAGPEDILIGGGSPVTLRLYDRKGRHVGPNPTGGVDEGILGARYYTNDVTHQQFIFVPDVNLRDGYVLQVQGTGDGTFDLDLFVGDRRERGRLHLQYLDVPVEAGSRAELTLARDGDHALQLDTDNDGTYEAQRLPTSAKELPVLFYPHRRGSTAPTLVVGGSLGFLAVAAWLILRRRRRRHLAPVPVGQVSPTCACCGTVAQRPKARFCSRCGAPLPPAASIAQSQRQRLARDWFIVLLSTAAAGVCFFLLPWIDHDGSIATGWSLPLHFSVLDFREAGRGLSSQVVLLAPAWAALALLLLAWRRRYPRAVAVIHTILGVTVLAFLGWALAQSGIFAHARSGLWGMLLGLTGIAVGGMLAWMRQR